MYSNAAKLTSVNIVSKLKGISYKVKHLLRMNQHWTLCIIYIKHYSIINHQQPISMNQVITGF